MFAALKHANIEIAARVLESTHFRFIKCKGFS